MKFRLLPADRAELSDMLRMWPTLLVALITFGIVHAIAPQQTGILVYTIAKLSLAGYLGYWLDRWVFPDARPGEQMKATSAHRHLEVVAAMEPLQVNDGDIKLAHDAAARQDWLNVAAQFRRAAIIIGTVVASGLMS